MATYIDQRDAAITAIQALIAPNGVGAITGQVHQDNEVGQTEDAYLNLFAYDNFGFVIVRTGIDPATGNEVNTAAQNGANLLAAYAAASALTPNGQPLSATNRAAVLVPPGVYSFGAGKLIMDTEFVDIIGLGAPENIVITSQYAVNDGTGTITKTCDNAIIKNVTISNGAAWSGDTGLLDASGFAPQGVYNQEVVENVIFYSASAANPYMRQDVEYAGTYINCKVNRQGFNTWIMFAGASGTFKGCDAKNDYGFGFVFNPTLATFNTSGNFEDCSCFIGFGWYASGFTGSITGTFKNCTGFASSFGNVFGTSITGTFINCKSGDNSFGAYDSSSSITNNGQYFNCIGGNSCFSGISLGGSFNNCSAGQNSFCGYQNIFSSAIFRNCISGFASFLSSTNENDGSFYDCKADIASFCAPNDSINGYFENCTGKGQAFCAGAINSGIYRNCFAESGSFSGADIDGTYFNCEAGDNSFKSIATNSAKYKKCVAGDDSFNGASVSGEFYSCIGEDNCFGSNNAVVVDGKFYNCVAGSNSFGHGDGAVASGQFYNCRAGVMSFGSNGALGLNTCFASGYFVDCSGGSFSFAGHANAYKSGKFIRCVLQGDSATGIAANDEGPLVENGLMEDCTWVISGPLEAALLLGNINSPIAPGDEPPKIYGGKYIAGAGAGRSIEMINIATATPSASIVQIRTNVAIDGAINNLATAGALNSEGNYIYSGL